MLINLTSQIDSKITLATNKLSSKPPKVEIKDQCQNDLFIKRTKYTYKLTVIKDLQVWLKINGFYQGKIDGIYGPKTGQAIRNFQRNSNLKVDGIIGPETWRCIGNYPSVPTTKNNKPLSDQRAKIYVDITNKTVILQKDNNYFKTYNAAVGKFYTPTPIGNWQIRRKAKNWGTGFGSRWLGLNVIWGEYGIHGTNQPWSVGRAASHGCVRMANSQVEDLYEHVQAGNKVYIFGNPFGPLHKPIRVLMRGEKGTDIMEIQKQLERLGYFHGEIDGKFGMTTEKAIKAMQKEMKVEVTAHIGAIEYQRLGFGEIKEIRIREKKVKMNAN